MHYQVKPMKADRKRTRSNDLKAFAIRFIEA